MNKLIITLLLAAFVASQAVQTPSVDAKTETLSGSFKEGQNNAASVKVYFEGFDAFLGYNSSEKKTIDINVRPDLSNNNIVVGDNSTSANWGVSCTSSNSCALTSSQCSGTTYLGVPYDCTIGTTNLYFNKDQKYQDFIDNNHSLNVQFTTLNNATWPLDQSALVGMGPQSEFIKYVLNTYKLNNDNTYELNFFYDILKKDNRYQADDKGTFDITMKNFGQNKGNLQDESNAYVKAPNLAANAQYWYLSTSSIFGMIGETKTEVLTNGAQNAVITNSENSYMSLDAAQITILKSIIDPIAGCTSTPCMAADVDLDNDALNTNYITMVVAIDNNQTLGLQIPIKDLIYKDSNEDHLQYSVSDVAAVRALGICDANTNVVLGRQFLINTYVTFSVTSTGDRFINVGQLMDMGKITPTERLWLMLFGCLMVLLILIALVVKLVRGKKSDNSDYQRAS